LPDGRAYEQVSVARKLGYSIGGNADAVVELGVDRTGDRVLYKGIFPLPPSQTASNAAFGAVRATAAWDTTSLFPAPGPIQVGFGLPAFSQVLLASTPDQRTIVFWDNSTAPYGSLNIRRADGTIAKIVDATSNLNLFGAGAGQAWAAGIADDGSRVVFASNQRLLPGLPAGATDILYEWVDDGASGTIRVVNRTNDPTLTLIAAAHAELGGSTNSATARANQGVRGLRHAISDGSDGHRRIFFQTPAPSSDTTLTGGPIYMREDDARTVEVSAPEGANVAGSQRRYLDASADGRHVFFWTDGRLTDDGVAGGAIYRYDVDPAGGAGDLVFIGAAPAIGGAPPTAIASDSGAELLYQGGADVVAHAGGTNRILLQGEVIGGRFGFRGSVPVSIGASAGIRDDRCPSAAVTPDGRFFTFVVGGLVASTIYRYDTVATELKEVSATPDIPSGSSLNVFMGTCAATGAPRPVRNRLISDDGRRIFFDTSAEFVPEDNNDRIDVYEWFDDGTPAGRISLISAGTGREQSGFVGMDATGDNAFFVTADPLVPQDVDTVYDIYNARVGGGFPFTRAAPPCSGDDCQGSGPSEAQSPVIASEIFFGAGNLEETSVAPARPARVTVLRGAVRGSTIAIRVRVPMRGSLVVSGSRTRTARRTLKRGGAHVVRVRLTRAATRRLKRNGRLSVRVRVSYTPTGGTTSTAALTLRTKG